MSTLRQVPGERARNLVSNPLRRGEGLAAVPSQKECYCFPKGVDGLPVERRGEAHRFVSCGRFAFYYSVH